MSLEVKAWSKVPEKQLKELFLHNPYPLYRGTPLADDRMKEYMFHLAKESAEANEEASLVALTNDKPVFSAQVFEISYLSQFWGTSIGALGHIVTDRPLDGDLDVAVDALLEEIIGKAKAMNISFLSANIPGSSILVIRAMERHSFRYAEGFINMVGPTNWVRDAFRVPGMNIRSLVESDFSEIAEAYEQVSFPSRFVTDGRFDKKKALELYVNRFREVYSQELGEIFVAELDEQFAGAIIAIIDSKMERTINVKTNALSGMGIIVHPRASRRGVATSLIEHRQSFYKSRGVEYVNFGANFNNRPMLLGLDKLGLKFGSLDMTFHLWLDK